MRISFIFLFAINLFALDLTYMKAFKLFNKGVLLNKTDPNLAEDYFTKAYNLLKNYPNKYNSNIHAMLGKMYLNGWGIKKNYKKALNEFLTAEKLGNRRIHCQLLKLYAILNDKTKAKKELNYVLTHKNLNCKIDENILKELK